MWGAVHGKGHVVTALAIGWLTAAGNVVDRAMQWLAPDLKLPMWLMWLPEFALGVLFVLIAAAAGATLVGLYLVLSDRLFGWHRNDVFSAQSIIDYRNFLLLGIQPDGSLVIYPIGLRQVPRQWRARITVERRVGGTCRDAGASALRAWRLRPQPAPDRGADPHSLPNPLFLSVPAP